MKATIHKFFLVAGALAAGLFAGCAPAEEVDVVRPEWPDSVLELAASLPVQDGGRIKPLQTYASFRLLPINGKRTLTFADKEKMTAMEWYLTTLFFPEHSDDYEVFQVRDSAVIDAIGLPHADKKKSDRYSYNELRPGFKTLFQLLEQYSRIEQNNRDSVQQQIVNLATNVSAYHDIRTSLDFARYSHGVGHTDEVRENARVKELFADPSKVTFSQIVSRLPDIVSVHNELRTAGQTEVADELNHVYGDARDAAAVTSRTCAMFPPGVSKEEESEWMTPVDIAEIGMFPTYDMPEGHIAALASFEKLVELRDDFTAFESEFENLHGALVGMAVERGEYSKVPIELSYYNGKYVMNALVLFVLSFVLMGFMWLRPRNAWIYRGTMLAVASGLVTLITAITLRCIIRDRPPISTLYETILFVTAGWALVALVAELINKKRVMLSAGAFLGMLGLFLANKFELVDKQDTMPSLVAVLDTNFWLATHVTAITTGYSAGLLAAAVSSFYLIAKLIGVKKGDKAFYRGMARMSYGILCFALIFSLVGTILGGVWANDSWGRFWGWDPKENGALLICISQIAILHARLGGYLRQHSLQMATAFAGTIIAFSWFGVNLLGVGLHSYGFTSGISTALVTYYLIQWGIVGLGGIALLLERSAQAALRAAAQESAALKTDQSPV